MLQKCFGVYNFGSKNPASGCGNVTYNKQGVIFYYFSAYETYLNDQHPHHWDVAEMLQQAGCQLPLSSRAVMK